MLRDEDPSGTGIRGDRAPETLGAGDPEERAGRAGAASPADLSCPSRRPVGPGHVAHLAQVRRGRTPFPGSQVTPGRSGGGRSRDAAVAGPRPQAQPGLSAPLPACCRCLLGVFPGGAARPGPGGSSRPRPAGRDGPCPPPLLPPSLHRGSPRSRPRPPRDGGAPGAAPPPRPASSPCAPGLSRDRRPQAVCPGPSPRAGGQTPTLPPAVPLLSLFSPLCPFPLLWDLPCCRPGGLVSVGAFPRRRMGGSGLRGPCWGRLGFRELKNEAGSAVGS